MFKLVRQLQKRVKNIFSKLLEFNLEQNRRKSKLKKTLKIQNFLILASFSSPLLCTPLFFFLSFFCRFLFSLSLHLLCVFRSTCIFLYLLLSEVLCSDVRPTRGGPSCPVAGVTAGRRGADQPRGPAQVSPSPPQLFVQVEAFRV